jgi:hypothetical protein
MRKAQVRLSLLDRPARRRPWVETRPGDLGVHAVRSTQHPGNRIQHAAAASCYVTIATRARFCFAAAIDAPVEAFTAEATAPPGLELYPSTMRSRAGSDNEVGPGTISPSAVSSYPAGTTARTS